MDSASFMENLMRAAAAAGATVIKPDEVDQYVHPDPEEPTFSESDRDWPFNSMAHDHKLLGTPAMIDCVDAADLTPLLFYRNYVARNIPVIIDGAINHWPALQKWKSNAYLKEKAGDEEVTIAFTPDGRADSIVMGELFCTPVEEKMRFGKFLDLIEAETGEGGDAADAGKEGVKQRGQGDEAKDAARSPSSSTSSSATTASGTAAAAAAAAGAGAAAAVSVEDAEDSDEDAPQGVPYCQHQDGSFLKEFAKLHGDADTELPLANEAFGSKPDAVNLWIGDDRSITTMHSDNYENMYAVVCGVKHFTLLPPTDYYFLSRNRYAKGQLHRLPNQGKGAGAAAAAAGAGAAGGAEAAEAKTREFVAGAFVAREEVGAEPVPWLDVDVDYPSAADEKKVQLDQLSKFNVSVRAGQLLYLPAQWYHAVRQSGRFVNRRSEFGVL